MAIIMYVELDDIQRLLPAGKPRLYDQETARRRCSSLVAKLQPHIAGSDPRHDGWGHFLGRAAHFGNQLTTPPEIGRTPLRRHEPDRA